MVLVVRVGGMPAGFPGFALPLPPARPAMRLESRQTRRSRQRRVPYSLVDESPAQSTVGL